MKNTSKEEIYPEWLFGRNPKAIINQEKEGKEKLINNGNLLPTKELIPGQREILEKEGVIFKEPLKNDPLFTEIELPHGWKIRTTEHIYYTELINDKGEIRAEIFYKAAFYDRRADWIIPKKAF